MTPKTRLTLWFAAAALALAPAPAVHLGQTAAIAAVILITLGLAGLIRLIETTPPDAIRLTPELSALLIAAGSGWQLAWLAALHNRVYVGLWIASGGVALLVLGAVSVLGAIPARWPVRTPWLAVSLAWAPIGTLAPLDERFGRGPVADAALHAALWPGLVIAAAVAVLGASAGLPRPAASAAYAGMTLLGAAAVLGLT